MFTDKNNLKTTLTFFITLILVISSLILGITFFKEPKISSKNKKLKELNNIDKKITYFNYNYLNRYLKYKNNNPQLSIKQVILDVNMNIDLPYYTNTKEVKNLNTITMLVNKYNYLPNNYIPNNLEKLDLSYSKEGMFLVKEAKVAFEKMHNDALLKNYNIIVMSSYRSYKYQENLYNQYTKKDGQKIADTYSSRPGHSEHQTGLAIDIYNGEVDYTNFENTKEFSWMQKNAHKYGFILRFPKNKVKETGYMYESWHYRYVGKEIAKYIYKHNISFEEYYAKFLEIE